MTGYTYIDVTEQQLEDLLRQYVDRVEDGLRYVAHQRFTESGRLDVLLVDSGRSLVLTELKVIDDDTMLFQAIDYYDYVSSHVEAFARLYSAFLIDPTQPVVVPDCTEFFPISDHPLQVDRCPDFSRHVQVY
jgi:hypothetical protein